MYLALAVKSNLRLLGGKGTVIGTEHEASKAEKAKTYWREAGEEVGQIIDLREGDLRDSLPGKLPALDLVLLDSELPSQKIISPQSSNTTRSLGTHCIASSSNSRAVSCSRRRHHLRQLDWIGTPLQRSSGIHASTRQWLHQPDDAVLEGFGVERMGGERTIASSLTTQAAS
jgi:hypothetical protein